MTGPTAAIEVDVLVVGAGFAGLYAVHRMRDLGIVVAGVEAADGVGGTWWWNRYPGARCDIESLEYSYSFDDDLQQEWAWTERYATQPEILRYLDHVADRFDLRASFTFGTRVRALHWDEAGSRWTVRTEPAGPSWVARFVVMATGCLSIPLEPDLPGLDGFAGPVLRTSSWPAVEPDLTGARVGVVGTGSSGVQAIPLLAERAESLVVFQRTATYAVPARNRPLDDAEITEIKARYPELRAESARCRSRPTAGCRASTRRRSRSTTPPATSATGRPGNVAACRSSPRSTTCCSTRPPTAPPPTSSATASATRWPTPEVADRLSPEQIVGCKRLCVDTDYYATYDRDDVRLVDLRATPIETITSSGVRLAGDDGIEDVPLDVLVLATGFDAVTGALDRIDVRGRDGQPLREAWADGPRTYLGLAVHGFPNLFTVTGPGSPSVLTNMVVSIEHHVDWITDTVQALDERGATTIEADADAQAEWSAHVNAVADLTLFPTCGSWYLGANVPGKPRQFLALPGFPEYVAMVDHVTEHDRRGFTVA